MAFLDGLNMVLNILTVRTDTSRQNNKMYGTVQCEGVTVLPSLKEFRPQNLPNVSL